MATLLHKERGGLRMGYSFWESPYSTWPLAKVEIYSDKIIITEFFSKKAEIKKSDINSIEKYGWFLGSEVKINHNSPQTMPFIVFLPRSADKLLFQLKEAGYPVK